MPDKIICQVFFNELPKVVYFACHPKRSFSFWLKIPYGILLSVKTVSEWIV